MNRVWLLFLGILFLPCVGAWHLSPFPDPEEGQTWDLRQHLLSTHTTSLDNAAPGNLVTHTFPWDPEYSFTEVPSHVVHVTISYTVQHPSTSNGAWNVTVAKDETGTLPNCTIRVETVDPIGITLDNLLMTQYYRWDCLFIADDSQTHPHNHTIYINRTLASGTPTAPTAETIAVIITTEDVVVTDAGLNEIADAMAIYLPLIMGTIFLFAAVVIRDRTFMAMGGLMFIWSAIILPLDNLIRVVPLIAGLWMVAFYFMEKNKGVTT